MQFEAAVGLLFAFALLLFSSDPPKKPHFSDFMTLHQNLFTSIYPGAHISICSCSLCKLLARKTEISFEEFPFVFFCYQVCTNKCLQDERLLLHYNAIKCVTLIAKKKYKNMILHNCTFVFVIQGRRVTHLSTPMAVRVKTDTYTVTG